MSRGYCVPSVLTNSASFAAPSHLVESSVACSGFPCCSGTLYVGDIVLTRGGALGGIPRMAFDGTG